MGEGVKGGDDIWEGEGGGVNVGGLMQIGGEGY